MSNCFLLKDRQNHAKGYLLVSRGQITCRVLLPKNNTILKVFTSDKTLSFCLREYGAEQSFPFSEAAVVNAQIETGDRVIYSTSWDCMSVHSDDKYRNTESVEMRSPDLNKSEKGLLSSGNDRSGERKDQSDCIHSWPERRWPPPPCYMDAVYSGGKWQIDS